jgi:hypothetical protein
VNVGKIAGTNVQVVQKTDYPWNGAVAITLRPDEPKTFSIHVRVPNRATSKLYAEAPAVSGLKRLSVNGHPHPVRIEKGYAVITRRWQAGDVIEFELPLEPQRVTADPRIKADSRQIALRYGPLIYNVEDADQRSLDQPLDNTPLKAEWRPDLLGGVVAITGKWQDGTPMLAVPNFARVNRAEAPRIQTAGDSSVNYAPGGTSSIAATNLPGSTNPAASTGTRPRHRERPIESKVWMSSLA